MHRVSNLQSAIAFVVCMSAWFAASQSVYMLAEKYLGIRMVRVRRDWRGNILR